MNDLATTDRRLIPNWKPGQDLPAGTNRDAIIRQISLLQARMVPAHPRDIAVALRSLFEFMDGCGMYYKLDAAVKIHCRALAACPIWAIEHAINSITLGWDDHKSPPYPADLVKALPDEVRELRAESNRLHDALAAYDAGQIVPSEDERISAADWKELMHQITGGTA